MSPEPVICVKSQPKNVNDIQRNIASRGSFDRIRSESKWANSENLHAILEKSIFRCCEKASSDRCRHHQNTVCHQAEPNGKNFTAKLPFHVKPHAEHSPGPTSSSTPPHHKKNGAYQPTCIFVTSFGFRCSLYRNNTITFYSLQSGGELLRTEAYLAVESVIHVDNVLGTRWAPRCFVPKPGWRSRMCSSELGDHHRMSATQLERCEWPMVSRHQSTIHILAQPTVNGKPNLDKKKVNNNKNT